MKKLAAFICETRPSPLLIPTINNALNNLPKDTDLFIIHGREHRFLKILFPSAKLTEWGAPMSESSYNDLLTTPKFWEMFLEYDHVLIFQTDGVILRPGVEEFYEYDYVGSPWKFQEFGGNGGMSLRNPKIMHEICSETKWDITMGNEDIFFSNRLYALNDNKLAPRDVCMKWGVETIFTLGTFCCHAIEKHLTLEQCNQIKTQYYEK